MTKQGLDSIVQGQPAKGEGNFRGFLKGVLENVEMIHMAETNEVETGTIVIDGGSIKV